MNELQWTSCSVCSFIGTSGHRKHDRETSQEDQGKKDEASQLEKAEVGLDIDVYRDINANINGDLPKGIEKGLKTLEKIMKTIKHERERFKLFDMISSDKQDTNNIGIYESLEIDSTGVSDDFGDDSEVGQISMKPIKIEWNPLGTLLCLGTGHIEHTVTCSHSSLIMMYSMYRGVNYVNHMKSTGSNSPLGSRKPIAKMRIPGCITSLAFHPSHPLIFAYVSTVQDLVVCKLEYTSNGKESCFIRPLYYPASISTPSVPDSSKSVYSADAATAYTHVSPTCMSWYKESTNDDMGIASCGEEGKLLRWTSKTHDKTTRNVSVFFGRQLQCSDGSSSITAISILPSSNAAGKDGYLTFVIGTEDGRCCVTNVNENDKGGLIERTQSTNSNKIGDKTGCLKTLEIREMTNLHTGLVRDITPLVSSVAEKKLSSTYKKVLSNFFVTSGMGGVVNLWSVRRKTPILSLITPSLNTVEPKAFKNFHQTPPMCSSTVSPLEPNLILVGNIDRTLSLFDLSAKANYIGPTLLPTTTTALPLLDKPTNDSEEGALSVVRCVKFNPVQRGMFACVVGGRVFVGSAGCASGLSVSVIADVHLLCKRLVGLE